MVAVNKKVCVVSFCAALACTAAWSENGLTDYKLGNKDASGAVTGSAAGQTGQNAAVSLSRCDGPLGKVAVYEPQDAAQKALSQLKLPSPTGLIRLMVQQSGCFLVVERGLALQNMLQERQLASQGLGKDAASMGGGQIEAADFILTPDVVFSENNAGGAGAGLAGLGSLLGPIGMLAGAVVGAMKFKQAQTSLLLSDARSGIQMAAAEGSAEKADFNFGAVMGGTSAIGGAGAYGNTNEGKVVSAAFLDAFNKVVDSLKNNPQVLARQPAPVAQRPAAAPTAVATAGDEFAAGAVVSPKIAKVVLKDKPDDAARTLRQVSKEQEAVVTGAEVNGYLPVQGDNFSGWMQKLMLRKR